MTVTVEDSAGKVEVYTYHFMGITPDGKHCITVCIRVINASLGLH